MITGCATPTERIDRTVRDNGFEKHVVSGGRFDHLILRGNASGSAETDVHVYIEGDGSAWIPNRWVAADPTPENPVALQLMQQDSGPSLYLGRPCYFDLRRNCTPADWTAGRYAEVVVDSMADALAVALDEMNLNGNIVLIGFSGGGVLAMLLAVRVEKVEAVVTLAANLDVGRWTRYHNYSPLSASLDPAKEVPLPAHILQYHLLGVADRNVPLETVQAVINQQPNARVLQYPEYDHTCCWREAWPDILARLKSNTPVSLEN